MCDKWNALIGLICHNTYDFIATSYTHFLEDIRTIKMKGYNTKGIPMFLLHESE